MNRVFSLLLLVSCSQEQLQPKTRTTIARDLVPLFVKFAERYQVSIGGISGDFGKLEDPKVGLCANYGTHQNITIDQEFWDRASDLQKEVLVYHELGHCALGRDHTEDLIGSRPKSIMYPKVLKEKYYKEFQEDYLEELGEPQ